MRALRWSIVTLVVALIGPAWLVASSPAASAATGSTIAALAAANIGKKACSTNSLGGKAFESSCTGNGGQPEYWCADFARWVWANSGVADTSWLNALAGSFYTYGQEYGTLSSVPAVGDAVVFDYDGTGDADHVAIVTQVNLNGTIKSVSGDWNGESGSEARWASTSSVVLNAPAYLGALGTNPAVMGMTISAFVAPVGVRVVPVVGGSSLSAGHILRAGHEMTSPNGLYTLVMQHDGNLVEYLGTRPLWSTGTEGHRGARAVIQADGNLVVYNSRGAPVWSSGTGGHSGKIALVLKDDASLVIAGRSGPLWIHRPRTELLDTGQMLRPGQRLVSANGMYTVLMQLDGNLVEHTAGRPLWSTSTNGHPGDWAIIQSDGNLVVYNSRNRALWSSGTSGHPGRITLVLGDDGDLVVNGPSGRLWADNV